MTFDPVSAADAIEADLRAVGTPDRAIHEKRYLKSELEFAGATVWQIRAVAKAFGRGHPDIGRDKLVSLVQALWERPLHERRQAAVVLLAHHAELLGPTDLPLIERLVRGSKTWALVDGLATDVVGGINARRASEVRPVLDRWAGDGDFWVRRTSLLAELRPLRAGANLGPFLRRADAMLEEKEFFIRKAIGWVLREVGKRRPDEVGAWLAPRTHRASGVTMREAVRYLPAGDAERLMAAYRERRPAG
ncbi:MAG TPA: DNA alkylation repair protein [Candidatus Dormibacteraeota bacterium]|nr:DNA alkylation repair protein [Candidatus Dormibacteraeota bacterium]